VHKQTVVPSTNVMKSYWVLLCLSKSQD